MQFTQEELKAKLELHAKWLNGVEGGVRLDLSSADLSFADLSFANLRSANLSSTDLSFANLRFADLRSTNLSSANLSSANLSSANLSFADLRSTNLSSADLRSANIDFTVWFSCGFLGIKCDMRLIAQYAYHICRLDPQDEKGKAAHAKIKEALKEYANEMHRVTTGELPKI